MREEERGEKRKRRSRRRGKKQYGMKSRNSATRQLAKH
jgi:hypothetical protein